MPSAFPSVPQNSQILQSPCLNPLSQIHRESNVSLERSTCGIANPSHNHLVPPGHRSTSNPVPSTHTLLPLLLPPTRCQSQASRSFPKPRFRSPHRKQAPGSTDPPFLPLSSPLTAPLTASFVSSASRRAGSSWREPSPTSGPGFPRGRGVRVTLRLARAGSCRLGVVSADTRLNEVGGAPGVDIGLAVFVSGGLWLLYSRVPPARPYVAFHDFGCFSSLSPLLLSQVAFPSTP